MASPTGDEVDERLRAACSAPPAPAREVPDMSPEAITARLKEVAELAALCFALEDVGRSASGQG